MRYFHVLVETNNISLGAHRIKIFIMGTPPPFPSFKCDGLTKSFKYTKIGLTKSFKHTKIGLTKSFKHTKIG